MELFNSSIRYFTQTNRILPAETSHHALTVVPGSNLEPRYHNFTEADDIFAELEACRKSALRNLESYLRAMEGLMSDAEASETDGVVLAKDGWTKQHWRLKIDKDDLRRDLREMMTILDFLVSRATSLRSYFIWFVTILHIPIPMLNIPSIVLVGTSYALRQAHDTCFQGSAVWMVRLFPVFNEYLMATQCQRAVKQVLEALISEELGKKHLGVLDGQEFRALRRFGKR